MLMEAYINSKIYELLQLDVDGFILKVALHPVELKML